MKFLSDPSFDPLIYAGLDLIGLIAAILLSWWLVGILF
jgi:hypothetical protein